MSWKDKVAIVTGGSVGIGAATVKTFIDQGAAVVFMDIDEKAGNAHADQLKKSGAKVLFVRGDVSSEKDVKNLADQTLKAFGRIDVLINNAAIMRRHPPEEWTIEEHRRVLDINLVGVFITIYAIAPIMARNGGGSILNISSTGAIMAVPYSPCYSAAKAGILGLTRSTASSWQTQGVRINALLPGFTATPMTSTSPMRDIEPTLTPEEMAKGIVYVAGDKSVNGAFFAVNHTPQGPRLFRLTDPPPMTEVKGPF